MLTDVVRAIDTVADALGGFGYSIATETRLQDGLAQALQQLGIPHEREVVLGPRERIDFLVHPDGVGIEVKIDGSLADVTRQLFRYAAYEKIQGLLVVTSRPRLVGVPEEIDGKPVRCLVLAGSLF